MGVLITAFFAAGFFLGAVWGKTKTAGKTADTQTCKAKFGDIETDVKYIPGNEMYNALGIVIEKGDSSIKISYQVQPFTLSGGSSDKKEITLSIDKDTIIQFSQKLQNGDENSTSAVLKDIEVNSTIQFFANESMSGKDQATASKIKIIKVE